MALRAGAAFVDILPRVGQSFDGDVDKAVSGTAERSGKKAGGILGSSMRKAAAVAVAALAVTAGVNFVKGTIADARESNKVAAQSEQVIRSTGGAANLTSKDFASLAASISAKTGVDDEAIQSSENLLATFTNVRNGVKKTDRIFDQATQTITDMSAVQGDLKSNSILVGKALQDPVKGVTALQRVGVKLTDQQKAQIATFVASGKTMEAQKIILRELGVEFGGQAAAQGTAADRLGVAWGNVREDIGNKLIPVLDSLQGWLADRIPGAADRLFSVLDRAGGVLSPLADFVGNFGDQVVKATNPAAGLAVEVGKLVGLAEDSPAVGLLADAFEAVSGRVGDLVGAGSDLVDNLVESVRPQLGDAKLDLSDLAEDGVTFVANAILDSLDAWDQLTGKIKAHTDVIVPAAAAMGTFVGALLVAKQVSSAVSAISALGTLASALGPLVASGVAAVGGTMVVVLAAIAAVVAGVVLAYFHIKPFRDFVDNLARSIGRFAVSTGEKLREWAGVAAKAVGGFIDRARPVVGRVLEIGRGIVRGLASVPDRIGGVLSKVGGFVQRYVIAPFRPLGRFFRDEVGPTLSAAGEFFAALYDRLVDVARVVQFVTMPVLRLLGAALGVVAGVVGDSLVAAWKIAGPIITTAVKVVGDVIVTLARVTVPILKTAFEGIVVVVKVAWNAVVAVIRAALGIIRGIFKVATGILRGDFGEIWDGLKTIVSAPVEAVVDFVTRSFDTLVDFFGKLPGRVWSVISGLWEGVKLITADVFEGILDTIVGTFEGVILVVTSLPKRLAEAGAGLWDWLWEAFKGVLNKIIGAWNSLDLSIPSFHVPGTSIDFGGIDDVIPDIPELRAKGGPMKPGNLYLTGEVGPELIRAGSGGRVFPHDELMSALQGAAVGDGRGAGVVFEEGAVQVDARGLETPETVGDHAARRIGWLVGQSGPR